MREGGHMYDTYLPTYLVRTTLTTSQHCHVDRLDGAASKVSEGRGE